MTDSTRLNSVSVDLPATVSYTYDLNGNLTSDGTWGFDYDDENQLIQITVTNSWQTKFAYDGKGRRRVRTESVWQGGQFVTNAIIRYVYDGIVVIQERDGTNLPNVSYTRLGERLLARTSNSDLPSANAHAFFHADGNGNITAMVNGQQIIVARYQYDPFNRHLGPAGSHSHSRTGAAGECEHEKQNRQSDSH